MTIKLFTFEGYIFKRIYNFVCYILFHFIDRNKLNIKIFKKLRVNLIIIIC